MTEERMQLDRFGEAVETLDAILKQPPIDGWSVGPKGTASRELDLVASSEQKLYIDTLNDVATGLTSAGNPAWTYADRVEGMHALGTFFLGLRAASIDEGGYFKYHRDNLRTLFNVLKALKEK